MVVLIDENCHKLIEAIGTGKLTYVKSKLAKHPDWISQTEIACNV